ncbi:hypothetical protein GE278_20555 [Enterobacteriaceae bacterium Kacie_13]|nr:hypothetical protein GE278_20555 [Enterobacteriaceae bacterium Kacie_13]
MKKTMLIAFIFLCSMNCFAQDYRLHPGIPDFEGHHFDIDIKVNCPEGEIECDDVSYDGINKKTGARLHLKGRVITNYYSHDFRGFEFKNGNYIYTLRPHSAASNDETQIWNLNVSLHDKIIATDQGIMH